MLFFISINLTVFLSVNSLSSDFNYEDYGSKLSTDRLKISIAVKNLVHKILWNFIKLDM